MCAPESNTCHVFVRFGEHSVLRGDSSAACVDARRSSNLSTTVQPKLASLRLSPRQITHRRVARWPPLCSACTGGNGRILADALCTSEMTLPYFQLAEARTRIQSERPAKVGQRVLGF